MSEYDIGRHVAELAERLERAEDDLEALRTLCAVLYEKGGGGAYARGVVLTFPSELSLVDAHAATPAAIAPTHEEELRDQ